MSIRCVEKGVPVDAGGLALGIFLVVGTCIAPMPQAAKLVKTGTSVGVSPLTLALTLGYNVCNLACAVTVKWHVFESCAHDGGCARNMTDLFQLAVSVTGWSTLLLIATSLPPGRRFARHALATILAAAGVVAASAVVSALGPCGGAALVLAQVTAGNGR